MAENTEIAWCDATFNCWIGCTKVSPACDNCYAENLSNRWMGVKWGPGEERRRTSVANWRKPLAWNRKAAASGTKPKVFCASLADVFDTEVPEAWRDDLFDLIDQTPSLDWLLLTKRPQVARKIMPTTPRPNVWLGTTVENQLMAQVRIPTLLATPAKIRFLSVEPMLGPVDLTAIDGYEKLSWVIVGGESGHGARSMPLEPVLRLKEQCQSAGIAFFMKQLSQADTKAYGEFETFPAAVQVRDFPIN